MALLEKRKELLAEKNRIDEQQFPEYVKRPIACKIKEWSSYIEKKNAYDIAVNSREEELKKVIKMIQEIEKPIIEMLPVPFVWFLTDDESWALAYRTIGDKSFVIEFMAIESPNINELTKIKN